MNKIFIFTLIALTATACETSTSIKKPTESSQLQEPIAEITPVSRIVPEVTSSPIPTLKTVPQTKPTIKAVAESTKLLPSETSPIVPKAQPIPSKTLQAVPKADPITKSAAKPKNSTPEIKPVTKSAAKPKNSTQKKVKQSAKSTTNAEKTVSVDKLVADISGKIGCGKVNKKYKIQVATIAIAQYNPQSLQGLSRKQIRQAVKQGIADYPERAEGLVQEYRSKNCTAVENPTPTESTAVDNKQQVTATTGEVIPRQSGSCKKLRARGIKDIDVAVNPWAKGKDRDNDGIACESK